MGFANQCRKNIKVIVVTSLVWCMLDVALLSYLSACTSEAPNPAENQPDQFPNLPKNAPSKLGHLQNRQSPTTAKKPSLLNKLMDNIPKALQPGKSYPGDGGRAVSIPSDMQEKSKKAFKINQFNLVASDLMSLNRTLPDYRTSQCKNKKYDVQSLPTTSVIIVFHNEAWSTLLRTVHSIINRSPRHLLHEIIMVDDASTQDHLKEPLDEYVSQLPVKVTIIRIPERGGLIRARLRGAKQSAGQVLTFLDAHCECTEGWLEPLLTEIYKDRTSVVCPIIDVISDDNFQYITGSDMTWGGFNWKLNFRWYSVPSREVSRRGGDHSIPLRSPTMAGGLFSIDKNYFYEVGSYDPGMNIWGGENLEMSFRIWQCGGQVLIVTCSRVGHVFRKVSPYTWPGGVAQILNHNTQRIADVWMDDYSEFFYKINPGVKNTDPGDMTERKRLREKLHCKSFKWYLENIYPESNLPTSFLSLGYIKNPSTGECLDTASKKSGEPASLYQCHGLGGNQAFALTGDGRIQADDVCISRSRSELRLNSCHGNDDWVFAAADHQLKLGGQCLSALKNKLSLEKCILGKPSQVWELENYKAV